MNSKSKFHTPSLISSYATEADIDFVRASVRAIGRCALKLESSADRCVNVLLYLLQSKVYTLS